MKTPCFRRDNCRLCGSHDLELVLSLAPTAIADEYVTLECLDKVQETFPLDLFLCHACGHIQSLDVVNPEILFGNYTYLTSVSSGLVEHFRGYASEMIRRMNLSKGALVVDIGSNDGFLLRFFQDWGMRVLGIEPAHEIAQGASESGIETLPTCFTLEIGKNIRREYGAAAIVNANNVYAHIDDLADVTDGIRDLLAPDGVFVFEVSYLVDIVQNDLFDTIYHEHLCYHSVRPLKYFMERHGLQLINIERVPTKGGSLRGIAQLAGGPRSESPSVAEFVSLERNLDFDRSETFKSFAKRIEGLKTQILIVLHQIKSEGKIIAGYGASATVTTLIYHFDLGELLSFITDDNTLKQNSFSPGYHIPVLSPQALYDRKPDYVLILAWNYATPIIKRHQAFLNQGGHFITPMPKIEVI